MNLTMFGRLNWPPTVVYNISKRVVLMAKSLGFWRKKSLREREVSASNFCEGVRSVGRGRRRDVTYVVCVNA